MMYVKTKEEWQEELLDDLWAYRTQLSVEEMRDVWWEFVLDNYKDESESEDEH